MTTYNQGQYSGPTYYGSGGPAVPVIQTMFREIYVNQGQYFSKEFKLVDPTNGFPINISSAIFTGVLKHNPESTSGQTFNVIKIDPANGLIKITLLENQTTMLTRNSYIMNIQMVMGGTAFRVIDGTAFVAKGVI